MRGGSKVCLGKGVLSEATVVLSCDAKMGVRASIITQHWTLELALGKMRVIPGIKHGIFSVLTCAPGLCWIGDAFIQWGQGREDK